MKTTITAILVSLLSLCGIHNASAQDAYGTRADFLDANGKRIRSIYPGEYNGQILFSTEKFDNNTYDVQSTYGDKGVTEMKFIPYGTENYTVSMVNEEPENVKFWYEIISEEETRADIKKIPVKKEAKESLLCGTPIRLWIQVPANTFPSLDIYWEYSRVDNSGEPYPYTLVASNLTSLSSTYINFFQVYLPEYRKMMLENMENTWGWKQSDENPDLWYYDFAIYNEPMTFKASFVRLDGEQLRQAVFAAHSELYRQYMDTSIAFANGEGMIQNMSDFLASDMIGGWAYATSSAENVGNMSLLKNSRLVINYLQWASNFSAIAHANLLLSQLDKYTFATSDEREKARAQLLALRSHAYFRILQLYGTRWSESNNGNMPCAPLETTFNTENLPLATMKEIRDQCYSDLDEAMGIMQSTGFVRENIIEIDLNVARGIKMRLAMLCEDWQTADRLADMILDSKPLTSNAEMTAGFFRPADSWIWGAWNNYNLGEMQTGLYYFSFQNFSGCNGAYPASWGIGANAIDKELYLSMQQNDIRRSLFVMPDVLKIAPYNQWSTWHDSSIIDSKTLSLVNSDPIVRFYDREKPEGVTDGAFTNRDVSAYSTIPVQYGAQIKFYKPRDAFADAAIVFMRTEEILLSQAEACVRLGNENKALELLNRLNSMRCDGYAFNAHGEELLQEIQRTRKIELWGEGHSWFDMKRWNLPIRRKIWEAGNSDSGNWPSTAAPHVATDAANGWRYPIPGIIVNNNPLIDITAMGYKDVTGYENESSAPTAKPTTAKGAKPAIKSKLNDAPQTVRELINNAGGLSDVY